MCRERTRLANANRALEISRSLQGDKPYSSHAGVSLLFIARIESSRGELDDARAHAAEAATHLTEILGPEHPDTLRARTIG